MINYCMPSDFGESNQYTIYPMIDPTIDSYEPANPMHQPRPAQLMIGAGRFSPLTKREWSIENRPV